MSKGHDDQSVVIRDLHKTQQILLMLQSIFMMECHLLMFFVILPTHALVFVLLYYFAPFVVNTIAFHRTTSPASISTMLVRLFGKAGAKGNKQAMRKAHTPG